MVLRPANELDMLLKCIMVNNNPDEDTFELEEFMKETENLLHTVKNNAARTFILSWIVAL